MSPQPPSNDLPQLVKLAIAISRREGYGRGPNVPTRLNNPGDLMFAHQVGATPHAVVGVDGKTRVYAAFATSNDGWKALETQIRLDASRGLTLEQFVNKYAPASDENNPASYLAFVMRQMGVQNAQVKLADLIA